MAITFDATAESGQATDYKTSFSFSHTLGAGSNRIVIVGIAGRQGGSGAAVPTPTYGGAAMTLVKAQGFTTVSGYCAGMWVIKETLTTGANTVAVTLSDTDIISYGVVAVSWIGVDQATPTYGELGGNNTDSTPTLTFTSATNDVVITMNQLNNDPASCTLVCDGTERIRNTVANGVTYSRVICQTKSGAASVVMAPTQSGAGTWFECGASIKAAAGGTGLMWL